MYTTGTKRCPDCGYQVGANDTSCPNCSYSFSKEGNSSAGQDGGKIVAILLWLAALCVAIVGVTRISCEDYIFHQEHYAKCLEGYNDCIEEANSAAFLRGTFLSIADEYEEMMEEDMEEIVKYQSQAKYCFAGAAVLIVLGIVIFVKQKKTDAVMQTGSYSPMYPSAFPKNENSVPAQGGTAFRTAEPAPTVINDVQTHQDIDKLRSYKELLDTGVITQEEFETKKKQILGL